MVKVHFISQMEGSMMEIGRKIKWTVTVFLSGLMEDVTMATYLKLK